jgi:hypothetical protein
MRGPRPRPIRRATWTRSRPLHRRRSLPPHPCRSIRDGDGPSNRPTFSTDRRPGDLDGSRARRARSGAAVKGQPCSTTCGNTPGSEQNSGELRRQIRSERFPGEVPAPLPRPAAVRRGPLPVLLSLVRPVTGPFPPKADPPDRGGVPGRLVRGEAAREAEEDPGLRRTAKGRLHGRPLRLPRPRPPRITRSSLWTETTGSPPSRSRSPRPTSRSASTVEPAAGGPDAPPARPPEPPRQ